MSETFAEALKAGDIRALKKAVKADRHIHSYFGTRREKLEQWLDRPLDRPPPRMNGLQGMKKYAARSIDPFMRHREAFEFVAASAVGDALEDGVAVLEMSFDIRATGFYDTGLVGFTAFVGSLAGQFSPRIQLRPELGLSRLSVADSHLMELAAEAVTSGIFRSLDLYDEEGACSPDSVKVLYQRGRVHGLKLKAHIGEFGGAEAVRRTVEILELDEVQHGIGAAESVEVMKWLADHQIRLHICPTSNVVLGAVSDLSRHPIRALYDHGIPVTLNTDDPMLFGQSVSDEYLNLYKAGVFTAAELETIRQKSLADTP